MNEKKFSKQEQNAIVDILLLAKSNEINKGPNKKTFDDIVQLFSPQYPFLNSPMLRQALHRKNKRNNNTGSHCINIR